MNFYEQFCEASCQCPRCVYLINDMLNIPLTAIGALLGGRDHTTIMHARDKIGNQVKVNPHIRTLVNDIKSQLLKY